MAISQYPPADPGPISNNFVVDMNDTTNNTASTGGIKQAGPYSISLDSGDTSFDIYLIDSAGSAVGYSNSNSITASAQFDTVVILGVSSSEIITFSYSGSVNNADSEGQETGAGAYLVSISPSDLPQIDDTATVIGGNFSTAVEVYFESGTVSLPAKNIVRTDSTALVVTRPDALIEDNAPYDLRAVNTGVTEPTGSNANILSGTVTAGSDPTWVTTSPLNGAAPNVAFSQTLSATDSDGTVVSYEVVAGTVATGLALATATGVLSGTPTVVGDYNFTVRATDNGGNYTDRAFDHAIAVATGGSVVTTGGYTYHTFTSSDDLIINTTIGTAEYVIVGGGGGGNADVASPTAGGGGGAGGVIWGTALSVAAGTATVTVGAGGAAFGTAPGENTILATIGTAFGGGYGGTFNQAGGPGGSGGGGGSGPSTAYGGGAGTAGQGNAGGDGNTGGGAGGHGGGGGGAGAGGANATSGAGGAGGAGVLIGAFASAVGIVVDGGYFGGGGGGGTFEYTAGAGGSGGGGVGGASKVTGSTATAGTANTGGGGGGYGYSSGGYTFQSAKAGGSGLVIVRYPA